MRRTKPVSGSVPQGSSSPPSTFRSPSMATASHDRALSRCASGGGGGRESSPAPPEILRHTGIEISVAADLAPVRDVQDRDRMRDVIDAVEDAVGPSAGAPPIRQWRVEAPPDPVRIIMKRAVDELVRGERNGLRQQFSQLPSHGWGCQPACTVPVPAADRSSLRSSSGHRLGQLSRGDGVASGDPGRSLSAGRPLIRPGRDQAQLPTGLPLSLPCARSRLVNR